MSEDVYQAQTLKEQALDEELRERRVLGQGGRDSGGSGGADGGATDGVADCACIEEGQQQQQQQQEEEEEEEEEEDYGPLGSLVNDSLDLGGLDIRHEPSSSGGGGGGGGGGSDWEVDRDPKEGTSEQARLEALRNTEERELGYVDLGARPSDEDLASRAPSTILLIERDLPRTFPTLAFFHDGGPMQSALQNVLYCYTCCRPDVGYVQGMTFLVRTHSLTNSQTHSLDDSMTD